MRWLLAIGTRPEVIKLAPVAAEARSEGIDLFAVMSGQHSEIAQRACDLLGVHIDVAFPELQWSSSRLTALLGHLTTRFGELLKTSPVDVVVVQGDTLTAHAAAMAAFLEDIPIAHVEAGLRTRNLRSPFPEEWSRQCIDQIADYRFAPTQLARENLLLEGIADESIWVTGNTGLDSLRSVVESEAVQVPSVIQDWWGNHQSVIVVTMHRRENASQMRSIALQLAEAAEERREVGLLISTHPNRMIQDALGEVASGIKNILVSPPLQYGDFVAALLNCQGVMTDSGGIQEEAVFLDKPIGVLRANTERNEALGLPNFVSLGVSSKLTSVLDSLLSYKPRLSLEQRFTFGDGHAASRIVAKLRERPS